MITTAELLEELTRRGYESAIAEDEPGRPMHVWERVDGDASHPFVCVRLTRFYDYAVDWERLAHWSLDVKVDFGLLVDEYSKTPLRWR